MDGQKGGRKECNGSKCKEKGLGYEGTKRGKMRDLRSGVRNEGSLSNGWGGGRPVRRRQTVEGEEWRRAVKVRRRDMRKGLGASLKRGGR